MNILITGKPRVGKTTLIKRLIEELPLSKNGFYTEEIRKEGERTGFLVKTLEGQEAVLADISIDSPYRVGRYKVDVTAFENVGVRSLKNALAENRELIIIDEIGKMELYSAHFRSVVHEVLDRGHTLATISLGGHEFIKKTRKRDDVVVFTLNLKNRDCMAGDIAARIVQAQHR